MLKKLQHPYLHLAIGIVSLLLLYFSPQLFLEEAPDYQKFAKNLHQKEQLATQKLLEYSQAPKVVFSKKEVQLAEDKGLSFFIAANNQLLFWTNRSIQLPTDLAVFEGEKGIIKLQDGWYEYLIRKNKEKTFLALILIKHHYPIVNKYLKNTFHHSFNINNQLEIVAQKEKGVTTISSSTGDFLLGLKDTNQENDFTQNNNWLLLFLFFNGYLFIISFLSKLLRKTTALRKYSAIIVILFIGCSRFLLFYFQPFTTLFQQELFSPTIFAQSLFLPSLGDLIINTVIFAIVVYYASRGIQHVNSFKKTNAFIVAIFIAISPLILAHLLAGLIANSKINFDINYLLDLNAYSFIGIGAITTLFIANILFIKITFNHFVGKSFDKPQLITLFSITSLMAVILAHFFIDQQPYLTVWGLLVIGIFGLKTSAKNSFARSVSLVLIVSLTTSYGFIHLGKLKAENNKAFIAKKMAQEHDPVTEYLFEDIAKKITADTLIQAKSSTYLENEAQLKTHILNRYFGGHFNKYDINIIGIFNQHDSIYVEGNELVNAAEFFNKKIEQETDDPFRIDETINYLYSDEGYSSYFATIQLNTPQKNVLYLELFPKVFSKTEGYPELLLNEKDIAAPLNTNTYSFAKYKNGKLINTFGKFNYSIELPKNYPFDEDGFFKTTYENAYHVIYKNDKSTAVILSSPQKTIFNYITTFSYFFIITSILVLFMGLIFKISPFNWQIALTDFSTKIQFFIIASIFLSFILFSWGTSYYIKKQYLEKNKTQLAEKVQSVLIELEHKLGTKENLTPEMYDEMTYYLVKFSNVFYTDINLFDKTGKLLASSRPEVFEQGLIGKQMSPVAYHQIHTHKKSNFTHRERIGKLNYLSTYVPFRNGKHQILAYMNLPYFAKQNELENELSFFYTSLINIYGLLFLISTIIAMFFANYISEPVRMIKNKISALQLGQSNDLLEWESNDEIGALVYEYNKKVIELEQSASKLVKSERESAWREMAKQVAHEIKNPLTPMKLSIQQLERVAKDNPTDLDERIKRTSITLVEQIDTLTKIADEFSNFAKMPKAENKAVNLIPIIETTIDLFKDEAVTITSTNTCNNEAIIIADKNQLSRVFNNLIKNAIQAIPANTTGKIEVTIKAKEYYYWIEVKDNGTGISEDKKDKIFVPSFTTKSTGMGLGLAMVKNIVENVNGNIWFETNPDIGTSFFITFPKK